MAGFVLRRLAAAALILLLLSGVTFLLFGALPTDPARLTCGRSCTPAILEANRRLLGLDQPLTVQYTRFVGGIVAGRTYGSGPAAVTCPAPCLGYSFRRGENVTTLLLSAFPVTLGLAVGAFVLWMVVGVSSGVYAALRAGTWRDRAVTGVALLGYSVPTFLIGLLLVFLLVRKLRWMSYPQYTPLLEDPGAWFRSLVLPWITLAAVYAGFYVRLTRNQMLETLGEDFVRTARAKGLSERRVVLRHALRAGLTPIVTVAGLDFAAILGGAVVTEQVFNLPGMGRLAVSAVLDADLPVIVGVTLVTACFVVLGNLVVDLLYAVVDPRVRTA